MPVLYLRYLSYHSCSPVSNTLIMLLLSHLHLLHGYIRYYLVFIIFNFVIMHHFWLHKTVKSLAGCLFEARAYRPELLEISR